MAASADPKPWTHYRAKVAALARDRQETDPELIEARRSLRAERLAEYVERVVAEAPPLTDDQVSRITAILRPTLTAGGGQRAV